MLRGKTRRDAVGASTAIAAVVVVVLGIASVFYLIASTNPGSSTTSTSSSSTSQSTIQGVIAGVVTVGPSQPMCSQNQACTVDLTGYSLIFSSQCGAAACDKQNFTAQIAPSGHYSILLAPGNYSIVGLSPSCKWVGCASTFPKAVTVEGGQQLVVNVDVDTGIR